MKSSKKETTPLSTTLSVQTKKTLESFCKARGIKLSYFIEQAIIEKLEDEMDAQVARERAHEPTVAWKKVI